MRGRTIQKRHDLYQIGQGKELLLHLLNLCIIGALVGFIYLWILAAVDFQLLEWLLEYGDNDPLRPPFLIFVLTLLYIRFILVGLLPKLEIKLADKVTLWIKDDRLYIQRQGQVTQYARSEIRKIEVQSRSGAAKEIVLYKKRDTDSIFNFDKDNADILFSRPRFAIPFSLCGEYVSRFENELISALRMHCSMHTVGKQLFTEYTLEPACIEADMTGC